MRESVGERGSGISLYLLLFSSDFISFLRNILPRFLRHIFITYLLILIFIYLFSFILFISVDRIFIGKEEEAQAPPPFEWSDEEETEQ